MTVDTPRFRVIDANATPEEVAAIVAALSMMAPEAGGEATPLATSRWVKAARLTSRRSGLSRGEWRLSGRIGRRARA